MHFSLFNFSWSFLISCLYCVPLALFLFVVTKHSHYIRTPIFALRFITFFLSLFDCFLPLNFFSFYCAFFLFLCRDELKITNASQFKYATDEDLKSIGMSRPEIRRLRKFYEKHFPHGYLSKIKRLLQAPTVIGGKRDENSGCTVNVTMASPSGSLSGASTGGASSKASSGSPNKAPNNKHIIPADAISVNKQLGTGEFGIVQQGVWTNGSERVSNVMEET